MSGTFEKFKRLLQSLLPGQDLSPIAVRKAAQLLYIMACEAELQNRLKENLMVAIPSPRSGVEFDGN